MLKKIFPLFLILLTIGYLTRDFWHHTAKNEKATMVVAQLPVRVAVVKSGSLQEELKFPIDLKAISQVKMIPSYLGRIEKMYVKEGDIVHSGDKLYKFDGPREGEEGFFDDLIVRSPIDGVVVSIIRDAGSGTVKDEAVLTLSPLDAVRVTLDLPSEYYSFLASGMKATFTVDAYPGKKFVATLRTMRPEVNAISRTVYVEFVVANADRTLLPGMAGTILLRNASKASGLIVPMESIFVLNDQQSVFVDNKGKAVLRNIRIVQEGVNAAVVAGQLHTGEQVLTTRADTLKNGDDIYVVK